MADTIPLSPAVPKPAHIPDSVVYDFDMFRDPAYLADPHHRILDLVKSAPPIFWTPRYGGHWMFLSHSANFNASRDPETFSSEFVSQSDIKAMLAKLPPGSPHIPQATPICLDPPAHSKYRAPLNRAFSPKTIAALRDDACALANELIDRVKSKGHCEFMSEVAEPFPVQIFLKMMGLPLSRLVEYRALVREHFSDIQPDAKKSIAKLQRIAAVMRDTFLERQEHPCDDLISTLWNVEIDGKPTALGDMENWGVLLFTAGLDTVMNGMGFGVRHLAQNPHLQDELRANPKLIPDAVEELLRRYSFTVPVRVLAKDAVFDGLPMRKGDRVMLFLPAADLDPKEFPNPERFDLMRANKVHIAFNAGPHRCLGSHLARVELQVIYEQLLSNLPTFRLDADRPPIFHGGHVVGVDSLSLRWDV
jgi:cytochrome P450